MCCSNAKFPSLLFFRIDIDYLISSLQIITHGGDQATLGISPKGIKVFETYAFARHMMNRSVYFHPVVKIMEYMTEKLLGIVIKQAHKLHKQDKLRNLIPQYFVSVSKQLEKRLDKFEFLDNNFESYSELSEDKVWSLIGSL